jgi:hypothetical protein
MECRWPVDDRDWYNTEDQILTKVVTSTLCCFSNNCSCVYRVSIASSRSSAFLSVWSCASRASAQSSTVLSFSDIATLRLELDRHLSYVILVESKVGFETFDVVLMDTNNIDETEVAHNLFVPYGLSARTRHYADTVAPGAVCLVSVSVVAVDWCTLAGSRRQVCGQDGLGYCCACSTCIY